MGDISDMHDLERFMRSPEGKSHLEAIRQTLEDRIIVNVDFTNEVHFIATTITLDNNDTFTATQQDLDIAVLRDTFEDVLEREYYIDFPERRPTE